MKDLKTLAAECEAELRSLNIQPGEINSWIVNTRKESVGAMQALLTRTFQYQHIRKTFAG
ncbi:MAG: hypothetical protein ACLUFV_06845 [Acutalibacteraceae bacterium]